MRQANGLIAFVVSLALLHPVVPVWAASPPDATSTPTAFVFVPYDKLGGPKFALDQSVLLPYAEFLRLKGTGERKPTSPDFRPFASISQSTFKGVVEGDVAKIDAEFVIETLARPLDRLEIHLPFGRASVESVSVDDPKALLGPLSRGTGLRVVLHGEGRRVARLKMATTLLAQEAARRLDFSVPRAAASSLSLRVGEDVTLEPTAEALPATVAPAKGGGVEIKASCGSRDRLLLVYRPRAKATGVAAQTRIAVSQNYNLNLSARSASARVRLNVSVLAGQAESVTIQIPPSVRLLSVSGSFVKDWSAPDQKGTCLVSLVRPVDRPFDLTFDVEVAAADTPTTQPLGVPEFRVPGAARETGTIIVIPDAGLSVWPQETAGLETVSISEKGRTARGFRFAQPGWNLTLSRRRKPARVRADSIVLYETTEDFIRLKSRHKLAISGRGIFDVTFHVPADYELREAGPPELVSGFRLEGRQVAIIFRGEQRKDCEVALSLQRRRAASDDQLQLEPISLVGADEDAGSVVLATPLALRATERESTGLEAIDVRTLAERLKPLLSSDLSPVLGYRYFRPTFRALASIERRRTRVTCETARLVSIMPSLMKINSSLRYNVEFSAADEFQLLIPASVGEDVQISGADIKEKIRTQPSDAAATDTLTTWTIRLQRRVLGPYQIGVSFEAPLPGAKSGEALKVSVPVVRATRVARESGFVGVSRGENIEVRVAKAEGLEPRDVKELPPTLANASLGFRYFEPEKQFLELELIRHELESVLGALIRRMHIDTVLSDQRKVVHEAFFEVQNNREQYLELTLPKGMEIWSAFVRGAAVRPTIRQSDGARLIELTKSETMAQAFRVRLVLQETLPGGALGIRGQLAFVPPKPLNMPVLRTTWKLYLPRKYRYIRFGGTMRQETGGHVPWIEPAAELLLNDLPAGVAGGVAQQTLQPPEARAPAAYDRAETEAEKRARLQGVALEVPIFREGHQFEFSKLSSVGSIEVFYWKRKALLLIQGAVGIVALLLVLALMGVSKRLWLGLAAVIVALIAASLTEGLEGRLCATGLVASTGAFAIGLLVYVLGQLRTAATRPALAPAAAPLTSPPQPSEGESAEGETPPPEPGAQADTGAQPPTESPPGEPSENTDATKEKTDKDKPRTNR